MIFLIIFNVKKCDKLFLDAVTPEISLDKWKPLISEKDLILFIYEFIKR